MMQSQEQLLSLLEKQILKDGLKWVSDNKSVEVAEVGYGSPRISSEIGDCSMPLTFDHYNWCSLQCQYCAIKGTKISTPIGMRNIEDINVGDDVFSYNIETRKVELDEVSSVMNRGVEELVEVELENGVILTVTENHPVYVNKKGWVNAGDLTECDDIIFIKRPDLSYRMLIKNPMKNNDVAKKQAQTLKTSFASGRLDGLKKKLAISGAKNRLKYMKSDEGRRRVSEMMKANNPMKNKEFALKMGKTRSQQYKNGEAIPYWKGKKKPDAVERMSGDGNPMRDVVKRKEILQKIVKSWIANGRISKGEIKVKEALIQLGLNFVQQGVVEGPKRVFTMDFFLPDKKVCIEYDGHSKHYTKQGLLFDKRRDWYLYAKYGIETIRINRDQAFIPMDELCVVIQQAVVI